MIDVATIQEFRAPRYCSPQRLIAGELPPTKGELVRRWMERYLVHGEGDHLGEPAVMAPHQRYILNRIYEYDPATGRLLHDRVLILMGKGNAKTETVAHVGVAELVGPAAPLRSPHVVVSAASYEQADNVFGAAKASIENGPLTEYFETFDAMLRPREDSEYSGYMERIAARAGTADGALPTCSVIDEVHELLRPGQEAMYNRQRKGLLKREVPRRGGLSGGLLLCISTAGSDADTLLGRLVQHGRKVASGELEDPGLLYLDWSAPKAEDEDLDDPDQLDAALLEANPAAGHFLSLAQLRASYYDPTTERHDFERFNLNRWVSRPRAWIVDETWRARGAAQGLPPAATRVIVGFKGGYNRRTTALVGWTLPDQGEWSDYGFLVKAWDSEADPDWTVPHEEVDAELHQAMKRWQVVELVCDPPGWQTEIEAWEHEYGTRTADAQDHVRGRGVVIRFETNVAARMAPAVDRFKAAVLDPESTLRHDGDPTLARHIKNCDTLTTRYGTRLVPGGSNGDLVIDVAQAAVIARQRATSQPKPRPRGVAAGF